MGLFKPKDSATTKEKEVEVGSLYDLPNEQPKPTSKRYCNIKEDDIAKLKDPEHPVHKIPVEKQHKMREKGVNPVLKAEMDQCMKGEGGFWAKVGGTAMGGGFVNGAS